MPLTKPLSPVIEGLDLSPPDLGLLELAALNFWGVSRKEFLQDAVDYLQDQGVNLAEADRRIESLVQRKLLQPKSTRWICDPPLSAEVAANAVLRGRYSRLAQQRESQSRFRNNPWVSSFEWERLLFSTFGGRASAEQGKVVDALRSPQALAALPLTVQQHETRTVLPQRLFHLLDPGVRGQALSHQEEPGAQALLGELWLLQGHFERVEELLSLYPHHIALRCYLEFFRGDLPQALHWHRPEPNPRTPLGSLIHSLLELRQMRSPDPKMQAQLPQLFPWLQWIFEVRQGRICPRPDGSEKEEPSLGVLVLLAMAWWETDPQWMESLQPVIEQTRERAEQLQLRAVVELLRGWPSAPSHPLRDLLPRQPAWQRSLQALSRFPDSDQGEEERLIWVAEPRQDGFWRAEPRVQKRTKRGWTVGKSLLASGSLPSTANNQDRLALERARKEQWSDVWLHLVGHPRVFHQDRPVEVVLGPPQLRARKEAESIRLTLHPYEFPGGLALLLDGSRLKLILLTGPIEKLRVVLGPQGLLVPRQEQEQVQKALSLLSRQLNISSDFSVGQEVLEQPCLSTLFLQLAPHQQGLQLVALVRPLGPQGPELEAGQGASTIVARVEGVSYQTVRDLQAEQSGLEEAGLLGRGPWTCSDPLASLELLERLGQLDGLRFQLEWPQGERFRIKHRASWSDFPLRLAQRGQWFEIEGELTLEEDQALRIDQLLEMLRQAPGRFLSLGDNQFLALTEEFRQRLQMLGDLLQASPEGGWMVHTLAAGGLEEIPTLQADQTFQQALLRLRGAHQAAWEVPDDFQADLRDYQREGFSWLADRAERELGACLADDMGLGKTVQTLAVLLARASGGPALVVAPTSVVGNWLLEAQRFAPRLQVHDLRDAPRQSLLESVGPGQVVVASYGLLVNEIEGLEQVGWHTVILDEAQAIKNSSSLRYQAATRLQARARLATTGTPVENRLDELWSLFRFLNPGLLGGLDQFRGRFGQPIEAGDRSRRDLLRRIVHPFLLRRTKSQVLAELPSRTEVTLEVELQPEEREFYEALRRRAVEQLERREELQTMAVLAELMRLRRACCHPSLVDPRRFPPPLRGAKLEAMLELLEELRQGGHRALIFSQFVDHLQILRGELERHQFSYLYLDGSTPARERTARVGQFQAGEGEVFLISLKAGGVGLNLTGADYVLHMDPWWNPAVEDQASDRAHRMGQSRPVTIYRLVSKGTIEEKILALHLQKRELAQSLLEGAEASTHFHAEELLRLIREV